MLAVFELLMKPRITPISASKIKIAPKNKIMPNSLGAMKPKKTGSDTAYSKLLGRMHSKGNQYASKFNEKTHGLLN